MQKINGSKPSRTIAVFGIRFAPDRSKFGSERQIYEDRDFIFGHLSTLVNGDARDVLIVSGGSKGVELLAESWCEENDIAFERIKPDDTKNSLDPFGVRNAQIITKSDEIVVFWDGLETLVARIICSAIIVGKPVRVIPVQVKG